MSRPVALRVSAVSAAGVDGGRELRLHAVGGVSRREFGLEWDGAFAVGGLVIDESVGLWLDVALVPGSPAS